MNNKRYLFLVYLFLATPVSAPAGNSPVFQIRLAVAAVPGTPPPPHSDKMKLLKRDRTTRRTSVEVLYVDRTVLLDQNGLKTTQVVTNESSGQPVIDITFTDQGSQRFAEITRRNTNRRLAIIIDGQVHSAPVIRDEIAVGRAQLSGDFNQSEAEHLSKRINEALKP